MYPINSLLPLLDCNTILFFCCYSKIESVPWPRRTAQAYTSVLTRRHVYAGFMTTTDLEMLESLDSDFNKYWMPLTWFSNLAAEAREEGRVRSDVALKLLMEVGQRDFPFSPQIGKETIITYTIHVFGPLLIKAGLM